MLDEKLYRTASKFGIFSEKEAFDTVFFPFLKGNKMYKGFLLQRYGKF